jgi:hypothetical protein
VSESTLAPHTICFAFDDDEAVDDPEPVEEDEEDFEANPLARVPAPSDWR